MIAALPLAGDPAAQSLLRAVEIVRDLNITSRRRVPDDAPIDFVPARWQAYLDAARQDDRAADHRHYWELAVVYTLQAALRSGDIWVPGSRRYADPATHFIPISDWRPLRQEFSALAAAPTYGHQRLDDLNRQLLAALTALEPILADAPAAARLDPDGQLVVTPLAAEQVPPQRLSSATRPASGSHTLTCTACSSRSTPGPGSPTTSSTPAVPPTEAPTCAATFTRR